MSSEAKNLEAISKAIDDHNVRCPFPATGIAMNPFEVERLGWETIRGLPIQPDPALGTGAFRVLCAGEGEELDEELEAIAEELVPVEVGAPVGDPDRESEPGGVPYRDPNTMR